MKIKTNKKSFKIVKNCEKSSESGLETSIINFKAEKMKVSNKFSGIIGYRKKAISQNLPSNARPINHSITFGVWRTWLHIQTQAQIQPHIFLRNEFF
jgi:hypothetical protein